MDVVQKAVALARFYLAGLTRGRIVDFAIGYVQNLGISCAQTPTNGGEFGVCDYVTDLQTVVDFDDDHKVVVCRTAKGHTHVFYCEYDPNIDWFDPIVFVGEVTD